jgi:hypothetical protein
LPKDKDYPLAHSFQSVSVAFVIAFTDRSSRCKVPLYGFDGLVVSKMLEKMDGLSAKGSR